MTNKIISLKAEARQAVGKAVQALRNSNKIPAVLYGHKIDNQNLSLKYTDFEKVLGQAGESTLVDLQVGDDQPVKVLIHDISRDPVSYKVTHVDFYQVNMKEKVKTEVELEFINESPAVKNFSAILIKTLDKVEIECLPADLISHMDVDLSKLEKLGDTLRVKDLPFPENIQVLTDPEAAVALVEEPKQQEEVSAEVETPAGEVPVEGEKTTEENSSNESKENTEAPADKKEE